MLGMKKHIHLKQKAKKLSLRHSHQDMGTNVSLIFCDLRDISVVRLRFDLAIAFINMSFTFSRLIARSSVLATAKVRKLANYDVFSVKIRVSGIKDTFDTSLKFRALTSFVYNTRT